MTWPHHLDRRGSLKMRLISYLTFCSLILLSLVGTVHPQAAKSELIGEVRDQNGALVSNAKVSLIDVATDQTFSQLSYDGSYIMTNLKPGIYNVAVEADGFKQSLREGVRLATGERVRLDFVLDPGAVTELVTVVQDASLLRTESGGLGQVISNRKIVDIPLNGRNFLALVTLSAGVAQPPPTTAGLLHSHASMVDDRERMSTCSTAFPFCSLNQVR
jgi:hypothetical protein